MNNTATKNLRPGECLLCGQTFPKAKMAAHLKTCLATKYPAGKPMHRCFQLAIEGLDLPDYWMHVVIFAECELLALDWFLRDVWDECCDHISGITIQDAYYEAAMTEEERLGADPDESMAVPLGQVLEVGTVFTLQYEGGNTELLLRVVDLIEIPRLDEYARILARNLPPVFPCVACGQPATQMVYGDKGAHLEHCFCNACAKKLNKGDRNRLIPIANSPFVGVCG